jgi:DNA polymerase sigma
MGTSSQIQIELSWSNPIGIYKTELLAAYSGIDDRVKPLVQFVKYWAKARKLSNTRQGGMGSFAWSLTCIYFLSNGARPPVLPNLQNTNVPPEYFQGLNVSFSKDIARSFSSSNEKI